MHIKDVCFKASRYHLLANKSTLIPILSYYKQTVCNSHNNIRSKHWKPTCFETFSHSKKKLSNITIDKKRITSKINKM